MGMDVQCDPGVSLMVGNGVVDKLVVGIGLAAELAVVPNPSAVTDLGATAPWLTVTAQLWNASSTGIDQQAVTGLLVPRRAPSAQTTG
jgi:hypothetical protein